MKNCIDDYIFLNEVYQAEKMPLTALIMMYGGCYANRSFKELNWKALTVSRGYFADCSSTTHGHSGGGFPGNSTIDKVSFSSGGNATGVGTLTIARGLMHGCQG